MVLPIHWSISETMFQNKTAQKQWEDKFVSFAHLKWLLEGLYSVYHLEITKINLINFIMIFIMIFSFIYTV